MGIYDKERESGWTRLWLWNELRELCRLLRWPLCGGASIYAFWHLFAGQGGGAPEALRGAVFAAAGSLALRLAEALADMMTGRAVRDLERLSRGVREWRA